MFLGWRLKKSTSGLWGRQMEKGHLQLAVHTEICFLVCEVGVLVSASEGHLGVQGEMVWKYPAHFWAPGQLAPAIHPAQGRASAPSFSHHGQGLHLFHPYPKSKSAPHVSSTKHLARAREGLGFPKCIACSHPPFWSLSLVHPLCFDWGTWMKTWIIGERVCPGKVPVFWKDVSSPPNLYIYIKELFSFGRKVTFIMIGSLEG